jgi:ParB-like chromosome segregation protein Spo0J
MDKKITPLTYTLLTIPLGLLVIDGNIRVEVDDDEIRRLGDSLQKRQIHPIIVLDSGNNTYTVIDGSKRVRAAQAAGMAELLAAVTTEHLTESEIRELQLICAFHCSAPGPADKWRAMEAVKAAHRDWSNAQIAELLDIDPKMVKVLLSPGQVIAEVRDAFLQREIGISDCHTISLQETPEAQRSLLQMKRDGASRDAIAEKGRELRNGHEAVPTPPDAATPKAAKPKAGKPRAKQTAAEPELDVTIALPGGKAVIVIGADSPAHAVAPLKKALKLAEDGKNLRREKFEDLCRKDADAEDAKAAAKLAKATGPDTTQTGDAA